MSAMLNLPSKAVWVSPQKKGRSNNKLLLDPHGFPLHYKKKDYNRKYFHCAKKDELGCNVRVSLDWREDMIIGFRGEHNHDSGLIESTVRKIVEEKVKSGTENPSVSPRSICENISSSILASDVGAPGLSFMPSLKAVSMSLQRSRRKTMDYPPIPRSWEDMSLPDMFKVTADGLDFCLMESSEQKMWAFASRSGLDVLKKSPDWYIDGTFEMVDCTLFKQVWVIVCPILEGKQSIPCAFFMLPSKDKTYYRAALNCLKENGVTAPDVIHTDFESGELSAFRSVYPSSRLVCCDFHWKQCIDRKLQKLHFWSAYNHNVELQQFIRYLWVLSLVPPESVVHSWESFVVDQVPEATESEDAEDMEDERARVVTFNNSLDQFVAYFESTWIGNKSRNKEAPRKCPMYAINLWNKYSITLNGKTPRTTRVRHGTQ